MIREITHPIFSLESTYFFKSALLVTSIRDICIYRSATYSIFFENTLLDRINYCEIDRHIDNIYLMEKH